jgi:hypothetical protein
MVKGWLAILLLTFTIVHGISKVSVLSMGA